MSNVSTLNHAIDQTSRWYQEIPVVTSSYLAAISSSLFCERHNVSRFVRTGKDSSNCEYPTRRSINL